ncbi:MAG: hypothetical protein JSW55_09265 [Chloroflexota bacterium]|nr:MAG: hypothetical protein JSW55_09265 [Chloroflexota bacterium]
MNQQEKIYSSMGDTLQAFSPFYREAMIKWLRQSEAPDNWFALNIVRANDPEPFSLDQLLEINPYSAISSQRERYEALAAKGFLEVVSEDSFKLTDRGREIVEGFFRLAHEELAEVEALPAEEMDQLADLLERVVMNTLESDEPAKKPALLASRWTDQGPSAPATVRIDQYVTDLVRYRDDAHIAAWQPAGLDGRTWEALTFIWRGEATLAADLSDRLSSRGYGEEDYAASLDLLLEKGWIEADGDRVQITDAGKAIRQMAEDETNRIHHVGLQALNQEELLHLDKSLTRLNERLGSLALSLIWTQAREVSQAIFPVTRAAVDDEFNKYFDSPRIFFPTLMAYGSRPNPFTSADYIQRVPYTKPDRALEVLNTAADSGCLEPTGENFTITDKGQEAIVHVNDVFYNCLGEIDPLSEEESAELSGLMARIVEATLAAGEPQTKLALQSMHACHPENGYGALATIDQLLDDLNAFRDDVHVAAWQAHDVSGRDWETLTHVWRGEANTAAALAEDLEVRGYTADEYAQSLATLVDRGWLQKADEGFQVTDLGRQIREEAELVTDRLFFGPWSGLAGAERYRLYTLLTQMKLGLQELARSE